MATQKCAEGAARAEAPPLYDVQELTLEEVMLLLAAEREEQSPRAPRFGHMPARKPPGSAD